MATKDLCFGFAEADDGNIRVLQPKIVRKSLPLKSCAALKTWKNGIPPQVIRVNRLLASNVASLKIRSKSFRALEQWSNISSATRSPLVAQA
jgi:hypothetical protein